MCQNKINICEQGNDYDHNHSHNDKNEMVSKLYPYDPHKFGGIVNIQLDLRGRYMLVSHQYGAISIYEARCQEFVKVF